jgi:hypothetical protein
MANEDSMDRGSTSPGGKGPTPAEQDLREQAAVLGHVLWLYPQTLTQVELLLEMTGGHKATYAERDRHRRAVRDLAAGGLLNLDTRLVIPTRAALFFGELAEL